MLHFFFIENRFSYLIFYCHSGIFSFSCIQLNIAIFLPCGQAESTTSAGVRLLDVKYYVSVAGPRHLRHPRLAYTLIS